MRHVRVALIGSILLLAVLVPSGASAPLRLPQARGAFVSDEVLVALRPGASAAEVARAAGGRVEAELQGLGVHVLKVASGAVPGVVSALSRNPNVEFAEPNGYLRTFVDPSDPYDNTGCAPTSEGSCTSQWAWAKVNAYQAWDVTTGSATGGSPWWTPAST